MRPILCLLYTSIKLAAVDQIHNDAQNAEPGYDRAPYDELACFFAALAVLDALDSGNQLENSADQCQEPVSYTHLFTHMPPPIL